MKRRATIVAAVAVAAAGASIIAVTGGSATEPGERTLKFVEQSVDSNGVFIDAPPLSPGTGEDTRPGPGDSFMFNDLVLNAAGAKRVGVTRGICTFQKVTNDFVGSLAICNLSYVLKDGTIALYGPVKFGAPITVAVIGGTGAYEGARGSATNTERKNSEVLSDTVIHLLP